MSNFEFGPGEWRYTAHASTKLHQTKLQRNAYALTATSIGMIYIYNILLIYYHTLLFSFCSLLSACTWRTSAGGVSVVQE